MGREYIHKKNAIRKCDFLSFKVTNPELIERIERYTDLRDMNFSRFAELAIKTFFDNHEDDSLKGLSEDEYIQIIKRLQGKVK